MEDRDSQEIMPPPEPEGQREGERPPAPVQDIEMFFNLRDVVRSHYLWEWDEVGRDTRQYVKNLTKQIEQDHQFRLVGDIEVEESVFEITLWLEETLAYSLASVDFMMLEALQIDLGRSAMLARELTRMGLEYHVLTFGDGRAQQHHINIIGPRMQQIRDLGTLVAPSVDSFSA